MDHLNYKICNKQADDDSESEHSPTKWRKLKKTKLEYTDGNQKAQSNIFRIH